MTEAIRSAVERAKGGDRAAFGTLVRRYQRRVYSIAYRMTGQHQDADDVVQEAFVRAFRGLDSFDGRSDFYTWLYRIVVNVSLNHLRRRRRRELPGVDEMALPEPTARRLQHQPERMFALKQLAHDVTAAIGSLSETLRAAVCWSCSRRCPIATRPRSSNVRKAQSRGGFTRPAASCARIWRRTCRTRKEATDLL